MRRNFSCDSEHGKRVAVKAGDTGDALRIGYDLKKVFQVTEINQGVSRDGQREPRVCV
jgi:hypothetical protein